MTRRDVVDGEALGLPYRVGGPAVATAGRTVSVARLSYLFPLGVQRRRRTRPDDLPNEGILGGRSGENW